MNSKTHTTLASDWQAGEIISFLEGNLPQCGLIGRGVASLERDLRRGDYLSVIVREGDKIIGHGGIKVVKKIAIFNALAVREEYRQRGIGRSIFDHRLNYCLNESGIEAIALYSTLAQEWGQRLCDSSFKPIGLCIREEGEHFYPSEIALFKNLRRNEKAPLFEGTIPYVFPLGEEIVEENISHSPHSLEKMKEDTEKYLFLGILPSMVDGLSCVGFFDKSKGQISREYQTNCSERREFIESILSKS